MSQMTSIDTQYQAIVEKLPNYEPRPMQEQMVHTIYEAIQSFSTTLIEAGTGSGKSFGYLIPALLSHERPIVVSTGTIALQEQLMEKDIPFVAKHLGLEDLHVRLVKGRRNYLCLQKLQEFENTLEGKAGEYLYTNVLKSELNKGWDGDKATLGMEVPREIWDEVQSDSEDCLGKKCGYYAMNPYRQAREDLDQADILVVNHALYLQDIISGHALLPPHDLVIFDEAHHLKQFALRAFTVRIGKFSTHKLLRKIHRRLEAVPDEFQHAIYQNESAMMRWLMDHDKATFKLVPDDTFLQLVHQQMLGLNELRTWLANINVKQLILVESELDQDRAIVQREKLLNQLDGLIGRWEFFQTPSDMDRVNWVETNKDRLYYELKATPLNIAEHFHEGLWGDKMAILTSATLSTNHSLHHLRDELGIPSTETCLDTMLDSPFDYASQCEIYLPKGLPEPNDSMFQPAVADEVIRILRHTQGRAFVLFTSYAALKRVSASVIPHIAFPSKSQGDLPKNRLIDWFKTTPNSVLFATASFWEGVDVPGDALSCVIIDRIPFAQPDDPVHSAIIDRMKHMGHDWFNGYALPEAIIRLKQGTGRLIRSKDDRGLLAILDPRLHTKGYGKKIIRSLPEATIVHSLEEASPIISTANQNALAS